jgi:hypothetical protein
VREIVVVISDLFLDADDVDSAAKAGRVLPGLGQLARFGHASAARDGWRAWLARWLGRGDLATVAPAAIAGIAASTLGDANGARESTAAHESTAASDSTAATDFTAARDSSSACNTSGTHDTRDPSAQGGSVWFATPVHLITSLTSLHLDHRGLLRLPLDALQRLAQDFARVFGDSGFHLEPTSSDLFILRSRNSIDARTTEPARAVGGELRASLPVGADAGVLKRLNGELEMWLHSHPINDERARRGELALSTLWVWGGGPALQVQSAASDTTSPRPSRARPNSPTPGDSLASPDSLASSDVVFASDPYVVGLCYLTGASGRAMPERLPDLSVFPGAQRIAVVAELTASLQANPAWTMFEALADVDQRYIIPALSELRRGTLDSVTLVANDTQLRIERRDHLKFWRRPKSAIAALLPVGARAAC